MGVIKEGFNELRTVVWGVILMLVIAVMLTVGITAMNGTLYPWWLSIQRKSVEQSKSFVDANNNMLQAYMLEYSRLDTKIAEANGNTQISNAYEAQQKAVIEKMCYEISTMAQGTVNANTLGFLNSHGGCR
jgi:hypothetical protein